jgi:5-methylcytosine-specific restriction endonuclease McrA
LKTGPWRVELDHIIPISKGGAHSRDNCQAAHARCNRMKSAKMPA